MTDTDIKRIYSKLEEQDGKLAQIATTLSHMAVQDEQLRQLRECQGQFRQQIEDISGKDGVLTKMHTYQASCPRKQIRYLWLIVVPMGFTQLAIGVKLLLGL